MEFKLYVLGTASALPVKQRFPSAYVLSVRGRLFLIDCGEGCQMRMRRMGISILKIDTILISHIHGDHIFGFFGLITTMGMLGRRAPLHVYAPRAFSSVLKFVLSFFGEGLKFPVEMHVVKTAAPECILESKSVEVLAFPLKHRIETYGYIIREKEPLYNVHKDLVERHGLTLREIGLLKQGVSVTREDGSVLDASVFAYKPYIPRSFAYCSDTAPFPELSGWVKGVSLMFHESTYASDMKDLAVATYHSTAKDAAECASGAGVGKLLLGHYSSRYLSLEPFINEAKAIFENTVLASDGDVVEVPLVTQKVPF